MTDPNLKTLSKILVCPANRAALDEALTALRGTSRKPFPTASDVLLWAADLDDQLASAGVAKTHRVGCQYEYRGAGAYAKAYKYAKSVKGFSLKRTAKGWFLTDAGTKNAYPKQDEIDRISLTQAAKASVINAALAPFGSVPVKAAAPAQAA